MQNPIPEKYRGPKKEVSEVPTSPETPEAVLHNVEPTNPMEIKPESGEQDNNLLSHEPVRPYEVPKKTSEKNERKTQPDLNKEILAEIIENEGLEKKGIFDPSALQATLEQAIEQGELSDNDELLKAS